MKQFIKHLPGEADKRSSDFAAPIFPLKTPSARGVRCWCQPESLHLPPPSGDCVSAAIRFPARVLTRRWTGKVARVRLQPRLRNSALTRGEGNLADEARQVRLRQAIIKHQHTRLRLNNVAQMQQKFSLIFI